MSLESFPLEIRPKRWKLSNTASMPKIWQNWATSVQFVLLSQGLLQWQNICAFLVQVFQDQGKEEALSPAELRGTASAYIVAGSDSTTVTLTHLVWFVCRNPKVKATLLAELRTFPADFTIADLRGLSYLNAVIDEAMRLYSGIQSALPRWVPESGDNMAGYWLLGACAQAYSMHRNPDVFHNSDVFDPWRWDMPTREMKDSFMPFGSEAQSKFLCSFR